MMLRLPGVIEAGQRVKAMVAGYDLAPTILDLLNIAAPYGLPYEVTGRSLWPLLFNLHADPGERCNARESHPHVVQDLMARLASRIEAELQRWGGPDPVATQVSPSAFADAMATYQDRMGRRSHAPDHCRHRPAPPRAGSIADS